MKSRVLSNGEQGLVRMARVEARIPEAGEVDGAVIEFVASDATCDRYEEIIEPTGWELENYRKNPVFLNAHRNGDVMSVLGRALITEVRDGCLVQRVEFAVNANPVAKVAYDLYRGGFLRAVSVGFIPKVWENGKAESGFRRRYIRQELVEVSAVGVPANPNALAKNYGLTPEGAEALKELAEILQRKAEGGGRRTEDGGRRTDGSAFAEAMADRGRCVRDEGRTSNGECRAASVG